MKKELEQFINENRAAFDEAEPRAEHSLRFAQKLNKTQKSKPKKWIWVAAAGVALLMGIASVIKFSSNSNAELLPKEMSLSEVSEEMTEVEVFYSEEIQNLNEVIKANSSASISMDALDQNMNRLEEEYTILKAELALNQGDERLIKRMIQNYKTRLLLLEKHLKQTEKLKQINTISNENA